VAIQGVNYYGTAEFVFSLQDSREWFTGEMEIVKKIRSEYRFKMVGIQFCLVGRV
jgi:hypothetical protein